MKERSSFWDNYKGILIILVVFGHFIYEYATGLSAGLANDLFKFIYAFHMPAFIFCSGYFSRSEKARSERSLIKLLLYYLVFNTAMMLFFRVTDGTSMQLLTPYTSYWYLLSLITWRIVIKYTAHIKGIVPISLAAALLVGFWGEFTNTLSIVRTVAFFFFFLLGYRFTEEHLARLMRVRDRIHPIFRLLFGTIAAAALFVIMAEYKFSVFTLTMMPYSSSREFVLRMFLYAAAALAILVMLMTVPKANVPWLTEIGRNSLFIYLAHRFITLIFSDLLPVSSYSRLYVIYAAAATIITVVVLGSDRLNAWVGKLFDRMTDAVLLPKARLAKAGVSLVLIGAILLGCTPLAARVIRRLTTTPQPTEETVRVEDAIENTAVISFVGDLTLLKDQVTAAYDAETGEYDFSHMFEYAAPYLSAADLAIGVLEGPLAGEEKGYSTSNYDDGYAFYLNFPDAFAEAIRDAGIDLLTQSNNHLLDMGADGAMRTLDTLDTIGIAHTGSYRNQAEKDTLCLVEAEGIKIAVLSYTQFVNLHTNDEMMTELSYITSFLPERTSEHYDRVLAEIKEDFAAAEQSGADLIVVLPHMGTEFSHETNDFQKEWNSVFASLGADIVFGAHSHVVQPIEYIGDTLIVNCPGNFTDSYISRDGDGTAIVEVYVNKDTKAVTAAAVIPLYSQEMSPENYRALPIYEILSKSELHAQMFDRDLERINELVPLITEVMTGTAVNAANAQPRYYFINGKYCEYMKPLTANTSSSLYERMAAAETVVFIGDGVTKGTYNGGYPWYNPLVDHFGFSSVYNISAAGYTVRQAAAAAASAETDSADLYVIAVGANDVRARNPAICAMTAEEYVREMDTLVSALLARTPEAEIVLIAPWITQENDTYCTLSHAEKSALIEQYGEALRLYAAENGYIFTNPNPTINERFVTERVSFYVRNGIYPNAAKGLRLYSEAVLAGCP